MPLFSDEEIIRLIEQAKETATSVQRKKKQKAPETPFTGDPIDNPDNPDVPKGGRWGVTGMGQSPEMFRTRVGSPGLNKSPMGRVKSAEAQKLAQRIDQVQPDDVIAYSRGAALYNAAKATGQMKSNPSVTYMAPSSYRGWSDAPVPSASGGKTLIGDSDSLVPMKQAAKTAVAAGVPMYVLPGFSHTGIMYSHGDVTPGGSEVDAEEIVSDPEMPDWGKSGIAPGGKGGEVIVKQAERVKQHITESQLRRIVRKAIIEHLKESDRFS